MLAYSSMRFGFGVLSVWHRTWVCVWTVGNVSINCLVFMSWSWILSFSFSAFICCWRNRSTIFFCLLSLFAIQHIFIFLLMQAGLLFLKLFLNLVKRSECIFSMLILSSSLSWTILSILRVISAWYSWSSWPDSSGTFEAQDFGA